MGKSENESEQGEIKQLGNVYGDFVESFVAKNEATVHCNEADENRDGRQKPVGFFQHHETE